MKSQDELVHKTWNTLTPEETVAVGQLPKEKFKKYMVDNFGE